MMEAEAVLVNKKNGDCADVNSSAVIISVRDKNAKRKEAKKKLVRLMLHGLVVLFLGMQVSQKGPAFLDLQLISGTDVKGASSYLTANNCGYMVGALLAGFLYDRVGNKVILICVPMTIASFLIGLTPWCASYVTMLLVHFAAAIQCSIPETTVIADQFSIWQGKSDAAFQFLGFTYSLGGVLGPLYTEPFLVPKWNESENKARHSQVQEGNPKTDNVSNLMNKSQNSSVLFVSDAVFEGNLTNSFSNFEDPPESQLYFAYMITGLFGILFSIPLYAIWCKKLSKSSQEEIKIKKDETVEVTQERLTLTPYIVLTAISSFFFFSFTMAEDSFNVYLSMFVVSHLSWTKENGALISSLYWGVSTIFKLIAIPILRRFDLGVILLVSCVGTVISLVGFLLSSFYRIDVLIWIASSCYAMTQSTIVGGGLCWVDTNILKLDGKATSITVIASGSGAMVAPVIIGITMDAYSLMVFTYIELIISVMSTCMFIFMFFFLKPFVTRKYGPVRPKPDTEADLDSNHTEMVVVEQKGVTSDDDDDDDDKDEDDNYDGGVGGGRLQDRKVLEPLLNS